MTTHTNNTSLAPVSAFVIISAAVCWWVMQEEPVEPVAECKPAILHQQSATQYGWTAYHGRCWD